MSNPQRVLIIDDSEAEREIMAAIVAEAFPGVDVARSADPLLARVMCEERQFDCVLLDYDMPGMDGLALASELRAAFTYLPIILITSFGDEMLAAEALRSGASDYLPKSRLSAAAIRRTVGRAIEVCGQARLIEVQRSELENFAYALAHDFKQPIRQIMTFAHLISEEIAVDDNADLRRHLTFLGDAASRLGRLVDVMSQYTLLNQAPQLARVNLNRVVASVTASLTPYLAERRGVFSAPSRMASLYGNEALMCQVLQNLVFNGLHYNKSSPPRVVLSVKRDGKDRIVAVSDNGFGIEGRYLAEIFKPLVRLHNASEFAGSGLGLTLARKAVLAQGGEIWCESTIDVGSVFYVRLPATASARAHSPVSDPQVDQAQFQLERAMA